MFTVGYKLLQNSSGINIEGKSGIKHSAEIMSNPLNKMLCSLIGDLRNLLLLIA